MSLLFQEEGLRKGGEPKYAHLSMELHVFIEVFAPVPDAYLRMAHAMEEVKKFLFPVSLASHLSVWSSLLASNIHCRWRNWNYLCNEQPRSQRWKGCKAKIGAHRVFLLQQSGCDYFSVTALIKSLTDYFCSKLLKTIQLLSVCKSHFVSTWGQANTSPNPNSHADFFVCWAYGKIGDKTKQTVKVSFRAR